MYAYIVRRLLLVIPTLFGIMVINFAVVQFVPGGPVEQMIAQLTGDDVDVTAKVGGQAGQETSASSQSKTSAGKSSGDSRYRGAQGLPPDPPKERTHSPTVPARLVACAPSTGSHHQWNFKLLSQS